MKKLLLLSFLLHFNLFGQVQVSNLASKTEELLGNNFRVVANSTNSIVFYDNTYKFWNLYKTNNQVKLQYIGRDYGTGGGWTSINDKIYVDGNLFKVDNGQIIKVPNEVPLRASRISFQVFENKLYLTDYQTVYRFDEKTEQIKEKFDAKAINYPSFIDRLSFSQTDQYLGKYFFTDVSTISIVNTENSQLNFTNIPIEKSIYQNVPWSVVGLFPIADKFLLYNGKYHARWNAEKGIYFLSIDPQNQKVEYLNLIPVHPSNPRAETVRFDKYIFRNELIYFSTFDALSLGFYYDKYNSKLLNHHQIYRINQENKVRKQIINLPEGSAIISNTLIENEKHYFISQNSQKDFFINEVNIETEIVKSKKMDVTFTWENKLPFVSETFPMKINWTKDKQAISVPQQGWFIDTKSLESYRFGEAQLNLGTIDEKEIICFKNKDNEFEFAQVDLKKRAIDQIISKSKALKGASLVGNFDDEVVLADGSKYAFYNETKEIRQAKEIKQTIVRHYSPSSLFKINKEKFILKRESGYPDRNDVLINIETNENKQINTDRYSDLIDANVWNDILYASHGIYGKFIYFKNPNFEKKQWFDAAGFFENIKMVKVLSKNFILSTRKGYEPFELFYANTMGGAFKSLLNDPLIKEFEFAGQYSNKSFYRAIYTNGKTSIWSFDDDTQKLSKAVDLDGTFSPYQIGDYLIIDNQNEAFYFDMDSFKLKKFNLPEGENFNDRAWIFYYDRKIIKIANKSSNELFVYDLANDKYEKIKVDSPIYYLKKTSKGLFCSIGNDLWITDGTQKGTKLLKMGISPNYAEIYNASDKTYFSAFTSEYGNEAWQTDGTPEGTKLIGDIIKGPNSSNPTNFMNVNGKLLCIADTQDNGRQLFRLEGINVINSTEEEKTELDAIKIYPNPTEGSIFIDTDNQKDYKYQLIDANGKVLINNELDKTNNQIQLHTFSSGIYFLRLSNDKKNKTLKIVKL